MKKKFAPQQVTFSEIPDSHSALSIFQNQPSVMQLQTVFVSSKSERLNAVNESKNAIAAILKTPFLDEINKPEVLFVNVRNYENNDNVEKLFVTREFINFYKFSKEICFYFLILENGVELSQIVVGVKSENTWNLVTKSKDYLLNTNQLKVFCRLNDNYFGYTDTIVLSSEPCQQGFLSLKTEIIFTKISDNSKCIAKSINQKGMETALNLMNFTSKLLLPKGGDLCSDVNVINTTALTTFATSKTLLSIMQTFPIVILTEKPSLIDFDVENACVLLSQKSLSKLKCEDGSWVRIWLSDSSASSARFAKVCAFETSDDVVCLSPQLWFNLRQHSEDKKFRPFIDSSVRLIIDSNFNENVTPVKAAHLAIIHSPEYSNSGNYAHLLEAYFSRPRYVKLGDIIAIPADTPEYLFYNEDYNFSCPVVYFKVAQLEGEGCLVEKPFSSLYQSGSVHSYIPQTIGLFCNLDVNTIYKHCSPPGLKKYVDTLDEYVLPYLSAPEVFYGAILLSGAPGCGKKLIINALCKRWNLHLFCVNGNDILGDSSTSTESKLKTSLSKAFVYSPCVMLISDIDILCNDNQDGFRITKAFNEVLKDLAINSDGWPVIAIGTTSNLKQVSKSDTCSLFLHTILIEPPNDSERKQFFQEHFRRPYLSPSVDLSHLSQRTAGFFYSDLVHLASVAVRNLYSRIKAQTSCTETEIALAGLILNSVDINTAFDELHQIHSESFGAPKIPDVSWEDVGGLNEVKREILNTIQLPLDHPELLNAGLKRSGVLLYGPPGTGKTLLAKAVAAECSLSFLSVKGPELINMYVGQSEENVREVFKNARNAAPCVIFFDELDSLAPSRGRSGDSGGVMDRVVSQLLAEMDGINKSNSVFVIGATNRPDLIDPALLRPGRFDRLLYVGIADDKTSRLKVLEALTRKFCVDGDVCLESIETQCPPMLTGADFYALCSNAMMNAISRNVVDIERGLVSESECQIIVCQQDFVAALSQLVPSVSSTDLERFQLLKANIEK